MWLFGIINKGIGCLRIWFLITFSNSQQWKNIYSITRGRKSILTRLIFTWNQAITNVIRKLLLPNRVGKNKNLTPCEKFFPLRPTAARERIFHVGWEFYSYPSDWARTVFSQNRFLHFAKFRETRQSNNIPSKQIIR